MKGRPPARTLRDSLAIAGTRGIVQRFMNTAERLADFAIVGTVPIAYVRIRYAPEILIPAAEIPRKYRKDIERLRFICRDASASLELWLRSRHGTWRFFRIGRDTVVEIDRLGNPAGDPSAPQPFKISPVAGGPATPSVTPAGTPSGPPAESMSNPGT